MTLIHVLKRKDAKIVRCGRSLVIRVVVMPGSSSIESTMLVCEDGERMCVLLLARSIETAQATTKHTLLHCLTCIDVSFNNLSSVW